MSFTWHVTSLLNYGLQFSQESAAAIRNPFQGLLMWGIRPIACLLRQCFCKQACTHCRTSPAALLIAIIKSSVLTCFHKMCSRAVFYLCPATHRFNITGTNSHFIPVSGPISFTLTDYFLAFGLLAPYLERACILFATPAVSRVPLTI